MDLERVKQAFQQIKEEIDYIYTELQILKEEIILIKSQQFNKPTVQQTNQHLKNFQNSHPTNKPTHNLDLHGLKSQNLEVSMRNDGVPTNKPTVQQTNQHPFISTGGAYKSSVNSKLNDLNRVSEILESLDELKKDVRIKFKRLTEKEMTVYSIIYQLEEQGISPDYSIISEKLGLTEISIRDYIRKILSKGIPLNKIKENNKKVLLSIPQDLKKIATLATLQQLRDL